MNDGHKDDKGKPRWDLVPYKQLEDVVKVLGYGADRYGANNWMLVDDAKNRYFAAMMRHIVAYIKGEKLDSESNLPPLAHAICCALYLMYFDEVNNEIENV